MFSEERRNKILELIQRNGRVFAKDLADLFAMSIDSIRRDLSIMEEKGLLKRTHGGAIPASKVRNPPLIPSLQYKNAQPHFRAIAKLAASFIQEGDTVFIGGALIHYCMLDHLPDIPFTVVTNSVKIADILRDQEHIDVYLIGGKVKHSGIITDILANEFIRQFSIDLYFVTGGGISKNGVSHSIPEVAGFNRAALEVSRRKICMAPHEKLGIDYFAKEGPITLIDLLITDEDADTDAIRQIEKKGVKVLIASSTEKDSTNEPLM